MADQAIKPKTQAKTPEPAKPLTGVFAWPGEIWLNVVEMADLSVRSFTALVSGRVAIGDIVNQMATIGVDGVWIVIAVSCASGAVFALYTAILALQFGFPEAVGGTLSYSFLNELGPVLGGVAFAARSGAEIAAEIGTMKVTEQVDALKAMAVSPIRYLVAPRVVAAILMMPVLTVVADVFGLAAGAGSASMHGVKLAIFFQSVYKYGKLEDLINGLIKSVVFGYLIGIIACMQGLRTEGGATGVGRSTTRSVVMCVVVITLADLVLTSILKTGNRR